MILQHLIKESQRVCPPTLGRLSEVSGVNYSVTKNALVALLKKGYVEQPYKSGPYIPLKDVNGNDLEWTLVKKAA